MRTITIASATALVLALSGCGMFGDHSQQGSYATPSSGSTAAAPAETMPETAATGGGGGSYGRGESYGRHHRMGSNEVRRAQQALQADGYYRGRIDGLDGPQTRQAVMEFQKEQGIQQTGRLDEQTMAGLRNQGQNGENATGSNTRGGNGGYNATGSNTGNTGATGGSTPPAQAAAPGSTGSSSSTTMPSGTGSSTMPSSTGSSTMPSSGSSTSNGGATTPHK